MKMGMEADPIGKTERISGNGLGITGKPCKPDEELGAEKGNSITKKVYE